MTRRCIAAIRRPWRARTSPNFSREVPGAYVIIGNGGSAPLHNAGYDFDDRAAPLGVAYWARLVEKALPRAAD